MVKKFVRLAISSEYSRTPIRRQDVSQKVLGPDKRQFKAVFEAAQEALRRTFGMEMVELPQREKVTVRERKAEASREKNTATSTNIWVLASVLPQEFKVPEAIRPPRVPTHETESAYIGLYSFVIATILLSGGTISETRLLAYLKKVDADQTTPIDQTDKLLKRLHREQYIVEIKDSENEIEYRVGPRGKVEVGKTGVAALVRTVYGENAPDDLELRLQRTLDLSNQGPHTRIEDGDTEMNEQ
ncbi:MAGE-domain-containing protein [Pseudovirgaria hyperparasitica]|uniref:MAGE-domain-containing protein n=1 Tax=Pseudovirgaria hyperparasitica TaxID=470096 RepID=A0A6A6W9Y3_9PEZI|nr:MAGE-domain-containing protein [Pseudovirgaria hyperparasitica]KAF2757911.1 MAGE-domain-containing protein [Pseudovirgaria hyperparasitica]